MSTGLRITEPARGYLAGRPLVIRGSHRNGCCGGSTTVPVAEPGPPGDPHDYRTEHHAGTLVHVDRRLTSLDGWSVDVDGLWRWRRLRLDGPHAVRAVAGER